MKELFNLSLFIYLLSSMQVYAQVHTPRYIPMTSTVKAYYEYLPQGYNTGSETYPLILFITGVAEFGDGSASQLPLVLRNGIPKLINAGTFPSSFTVNGQTFKFIVITPQFKKVPRPDANDVDSVLNYIVAHYRVNTNRIYITGLSYGGGVVWAYGGGNNYYAKRVAAIVPVASATAKDSIYKRSRVIAAANLPVWATHNSYDTDTPVEDVLAYINDINIDPAPNPKAKITTFPSKSHDAWTRTYDPNFREDGLNIYEWMLQFQLGVAHPPPVNDTTGFVKVNIYGGTDAYNNPHWNDWNLTTGLVTNVNSGTLKFADGTTSTISATLSESRGVNDNSFYYGGGMAPVQVLRFVSWASASRTLTLNGLSGAQTYTVELYASSKSSGNSTVFKINDMADTIVTDSNYMVKAAFNGLIPNGQGQIVVNISNLNNFNYLNGFLIHLENSTVTAITDPPGQGTSEIISLYPNPAKDQCVLNLDDKYRGALRIQVVDMVGKIAKEYKDVKNHQITQYNLHMSELASGNYIIKVQTGNKVSSVKMIKY